MGLKAGDVVTIMSMHTPETIYVMYGINYIGAVANMVYPSLSEKELLQTIAMYGGKVLEKITHNEDPWMEARKGYGDKLPSSELLSKESIKKYFILINQKYGIGTEKGLQAYIHDMLNK